MRRGAPGSVMEQVNCSGDKKFKENPDVKSNVGSGKLRTIPTHLSFHLVERNKREIKAAKETINKSKLMQTSQGEGPGSSKQKNLAALCACF